MRKVQLQSPQKLRSPSPASGLPLPAASPASEDGARSSNTTLDGHFQLKGFSSPCFYTP